MPDIIKVEHLRYVYSPGMPDATTALDDISFSIREGEFVGVIGSTGCGKSTLISHFNGINRPTSGKIYIGGEDIWADPSQIRRFRFQVGLVFQYPEYQLFEETVRRDIAYGPRNMQLDEAEVERRVREAAAFCGIGEDMLEKSPFDLSGGQKRRVAIAGVLSMRPQVLILDEPTAGLDPRGRDEILSQIVRLHETSGMTVLFVSHSMEDVAKIAKHIIVMNQGTVYMQGTVSEVFSRGQELQDIGLNVPQITLLAHRLIERGVDLPRDIYTVKYAAKRIAEKIQENKHV